MKHFIKAIIILLLSTPNISKGQALPLKKNGTATIMVELEDALHTDTLLLMYFKDNILNEPTQNGDYQELQSTFTNGVYIFKFPITDQSGNFFLAKKIQGNLRFTQLSTMLKADSGDSVIIKINNKNRKGLYLSTKFSHSCFGVGMNKFNIRFKLDSILYWTKSMNIPIFSSSLKYNEENYNKHRINVGLDYLDAKKNELDEYQFQLLKADLTFANSYPVFTFIKDKFKPLLDGDREMFKNEYLNTIGKVNLYSFSPIILISSKSAINYFLAQAQATMFITGKSDDPHALYSYLCSNYSGMVLDKLLVYYFVKSNISLNVMTGQLEDALKRVKTPNCLERLNQLRSRFLVSSLGDAYKLSDKDGRSVSLSDFKGKVVLVDFWFTGCLFCSKFVKEQLVKVEEIFKDNPNVVFISLCIDRDKIAWLKSVQQQKYTLPSSVNLNTVGLGNNHPLIKKLNVKSYPSILILDKTGKVVVFGVANENIPDLYQAINIITKIKSHL